MKTTTIDNSTPRNSLLTIGNIGIYFNAQANSTAAYIKFCLLNGISDNVVVDQLKMGSGGLYGGNQTFLSVTSNPYTNIIESIPPFNSNAEAPWHTITLEEPSITNRDMIQYMISLINTKEVYRLTAIFNGPILATTNQPIASEATATLFVERLTNF